MQFNRVKRKKYKTVYNTGYFQAVNQLSTILARQGLTSGIERFPVLFLWYDRRQGTLVNLCHIGVPKGKTVNLEQL